MTGAVRRTAELTAWLAASFVVGWSVVWGRAFQRDSPEIFLGAAPLVGRNATDGWDWRFGWSQVAAGALAAVVAVSVARGWWWRARLRSLVLASSLGAGGFATLLALTDGRDGVLYGATHRTEYLANLRIAPPAAEFVRTFVERIDQYSVHVRGHPPGFVVVLKVMDGLGLATAWPVALLSVLAATALPGAVLVTVWATAGGDWVRRVAPLLIVAPYLLWMVTSADAVYTAVAAWGVALVACGVRGKGASAVVAGAAGGSLLAMSLFFTYGASVLLLVPLAITLAGWRRGCSGAIVAAGAAVAAAVVVTAGFALAGFWWFAGLAETRNQYWAGSAQFRTWTYFGVANLAVALIALGPVSFGGALRLRDRRVWVIVGGGLGALLAAHASQYTRAEVERIWLLYYPWLAVAGGALMSSTATLRSSLFIAAQAATAIALQAALVSKW